MIIGIDGNEANISERVGVNTYAFELIKSLSKLQDVACGRHTLIVYLKQNPLPDMPEESANFKYKVISGKGLWILTRLTPYLLTNPEKIDIFFSPSHYVPFLSMIPKVCSIMDLGYLDYTAQFPKKVFWQLNHWTAISIFVSKAVLAISNSTKRDIVRHYPKSVDKVSVVYLGFDRAKFNMDVSNKDVRRVKNRYSIVDDYILYLGTLKPSKNIEGLIAAFKIVNDQWPTIKLVVAGKKGWMFDSIYKKVKDLRLGDNVIFTDFISEKDKAPLIRGAKIFALPSFWEGFGLDVLSAMSCGVPVVVSNVGSLPEVVGSAGVLVDPKNIESIGSGLKKVLSLTKNDYNSMVGQGLTQANKFSWDRTAQETLTILETVTLQK